MKDQAQHEVREQLHDPGNQPPKGNIRQTDGVRDGTGQWQHKAHRGAAKADGRRDIAVTNQGYLTLWRDPDVGNDKADEIDNAHGQIGHKRGQGEKVRQNHKASPGRAASPWPRQQHRRFVRWLP